jgi:hypothetical protein
LLSKNCKNFSRISLPVSFFAAFSVTSASSPSSNSTLDYRRRVEPPAIAVHFALGIIQKLSQGGPMFERKLTAGWGDMDFNSHMRNTAYLDKSADVRMMYFSENGFPMAEFHRLRMGPVILRDSPNFPPMVRASCCKTPSTAPTEN